MDTDEIDLWTDSVILKIQAITGWIIPEKNVLLIFTDQLKKKIVESYSTVNVDEIEYAFRQYGTVVKDWGKQMNLSLIDEVMIPYLAKRFEISRIEEQQKNKLLNNSEPEITDDQLWDITELAVKKGGYPVDLIPPGLYDWMDVNGNILTNKEEKHKYMERAILYRHSKIVADYERNTTDRCSRTAMVEFGKMREEGKYSGPELEILKQLAKNMVVFDLMMAR